MKDEALKLALQFIESNADSDSERELVATIKEALAQPEQAPNIQASIRRTSMGGLVGQVLWIDDKLAEGDYNLHATPPQRTWVGLTDEESHELWGSTASEDDWELMKRTEAKLKEKNT